MPKSETRTKTIKVRGRKRVITMKKVKPHGKNKNLTWKIISNEEYKKSNRTKIYWAIVGLGIITVIVLFAFFR